ncbi:MAG TPA: HAD-IA family hydrolase [Opitutaceae bacterium]|nr:HAD-IA family hydrolase [Opitutaceae bacterium]
MQLRAAARAVPHLADNRHLRALATGLVLGRVQLPGIRAITFDAAGTLVDPHPSVGAVYGEVGRAHGLAATDAELERRFHAAFKARNHLLRSTEPAERAFWRELIGEVFAPWADAATADRLYPDLWEAFAEARRWRPRADMPALLALLRRRGLKLAILSNWDSRLHRVVAGHGWREWLDHVFVSADLGVEKPAHAIFAYAATALGCRPDEILHVGDSWQHDVVGALGAGWHAAWIDRSTTPLADERAHRIARLEQVPELLA